LLEIFSVPAKRDEEETVSAGVDSWPKLHP